MIFTYVHANSNGRESVRLYKIVFSDRRHRTIQALLLFFRRVAEKGSVAPQNTVINIVGLDI